MRIKIQMERDGREIEVGGRFSRYLKWFLLLIVLWGATTAASLYLISRLDPLSLVDLEVRLSKDLEVKIDSKVPVTARLDQVLSLPVDQEVPVVFMVDQTFSVPLSERIEVPLDILVSVPVDQDIYVSAQVPLNFEVPVNDTLSIKLPLLGYTEVPVRGVIPVDMVVPVDQKVHVDDVVPVRINRKVTLPIEETFDVPLKSRVVGGVNMDTVFRLPVKTALEADVFINEVVKGKIDQSFVLDKDRIRLKPDRERTEQLRREFFFKLPKSVRESMAE